MDFQLLFTKIENDCGLNDVENNDMVYEYD